MQKIPKIIHYCWFGNGEKPQEVQKCIASWKEKMPEYELLEWNESNFDVANAIPYVKQAYEAKKFAFVSDYVRIQALYRFGGIYFDTDVEVLKPLEEYLEDISMLLGFESERSLLTAVIAVEKEHPYILEFLNSYKERSFVKEDGTYDMTVINKGFSELLESKGVDLSQNVFQKIGEAIKVYPIEYFCGFDMNNWHEAITEKTCTVHHMAGSWVSGGGNLKKKLIRLLQKMIGNRNYDALRRKLKGDKKLRNEE